MKHANERDYRALLAEIDAVAARHGNLYLTDECIDAENVGRWEDSNGAPDYYDRMIRAACMAAGQRAEDAGLDLNAEIGRPIY